MCLSSYLLICFINVVVTQIPGTLEFKDVIKILRSCKINTVHISIAKFF